MELMTAAWTDERLDERFAHIDTRFDRLEAVVAVKSETRELQSDIQEIKEELREIRKSLEGIHLMMHRDRQGIIVALIALIGAIIVKGA